MLDKIIGSADFDNETFCHDGVLIASSNHEDEVFNLGNKSKTELISEDYLINLMNEKIKIYHCIEEKNKEISSVSKEHLFKHNQTNFIETEFDCITINNLLLKHSISTLDILFIDDEGIDDQIIKSINFDMFNIKKIYYENLHIDNTQLKTFLSSKGYHINEYKLSNGWTNEAIREN
jgi:hypothetical protein